MTLTRCGQPFRGLHYSTPPALRIPEALHTCSNNSNNTTFRRIFLVFLLFRRCVQVPQHAAK